MAIKFALRTRVMMGSGCRTGISTEARALGVRKALVVTDKALVNCGLVGRVLEKIEPSALTYILFDEVTPDPTLNTVDRGGELARQAGCDVIVAVGGGSPIDAAKAISIAATNPGSCAAYEGINKYGNPPLPVFAVPTTVGTGSEVTFGAVLTNAGTNSKFIVYGDDLAPVVAFLDPELAVGLPRSVLVPTLMDALTHALESYVSRGSTPQSRALAWFAAQTIVRHAPTAYADTKNLDAMTGLLYAANMAGAAFASSRLGIVHAMALPLGAYFHVPHGMANAVLLPYGLEYNLNDAKDGYAEMARAFGIAGSAKAKDDALALRDAVARFARSLDVPAHLSELGVKEDQIEAMAADAMKSSHIAANPRAIVQADVAALYRKALK
ncbi:MAG: iron-containing alcohol dehydrogenase [Planctomycetes bacterium]|nr:iron-containing alcohol dehydrogenase [Planctomycetota bacterium]